MSRELLLARVGDHLHVIGHDRERAANILLQWVVARLKFDQSIRIKGIGVFQLKKEPLPRVDRKTIAADAPINKRTLIYSPLQDDRSGNADPVFVSFDLDELNINSSDYLDKVFSLNVDKPLIPIKDDSHQGFESKVFGEDAEELVEEKIETMVKNGELLENFNIFENYMDADIPDGSSANIKEDDLVKEELLNSMEEDFLDDIELPSETGSDPDEEKNILSGYTDLEETNSADPDEPGLETYENAGLSEQEEREIELLDSSELNDLDDEEGEEKIDEPEEDGSNEFLMEELNSDLTGGEGDVNIDPETDDNERDLKMLEDPELDIPDDYGDLGNDLELDAEEQDISISDSAENTDLEVSSEDQLDEVVNDQLPEFSETDDIELIEELVVDANDDPAGSDDFTEDKSEFPVFEKTEILRDEPEQPTEQELPPENDGVIDKIEETLPVEEQGARGDLFAQLEDYLKEDPGEENQTDIGDDTLVEKDDEVKLTDESTDDLPIKKKSAGKKNSGKTAGIVVTIIAVIVTGALIVYVFDFWGTDKTADLVPPASGENVLETEQEIDSKKGGEVKVVDEVQEEADERTGLYRDIKNDKQVTNQIYFDGSLYSVQVSSWKNKIIAEKEVERLRKKNFDAFIYSKYIESKKGTWNRVRIGYFDTQKEAENFIRKNKFY